MRVEQGEPRCKAELCSLLGYSRQSYYQRLKEREHTALAIDIVIGQVIQIRQSQPRVGGRKLQKMLGDFIEDHHLSIGRDKFFDLLRAKGLLIKRRQSKKPQTTWSYHWFKKYPNLIKGFDPQAAGQLWVSDITYIHVGNRFGYLSLITDAYSHKIVGFYLSKDLAAYGCLQALKMALQQKSSRENLIHHSDRGGQYCCADYIDILQKQFIRISMTEDGNPLHNAIAERVNGILKIELLQEQYKDLGQARESIKVAIEIYNNERLHASINLLTPNQAHIMQGKLQKHWKNYPKKRKEVFV
jgi:putative transposase